ncbi:MAG: MerR family transcriptional regulator [Trichlorobacter sp.]|jgi:DNA-binding transcriptional MerR regulator|nr:MerR family transcriptional regulator [Trichlorobacter sp.]
MYSELPDKTYFRIGEVADITGLKPSVLRYWESEFKFLKPEKSTKGQRLYPKEQIVLICEVKRLLYEEKYTIEGVRKKLSSKHYRSALSADVSAQPTSLEDTLKDIKQDLLAIKSILS